MSSNERANHFFYSTGVNLFREREREWGREKRGRGRGGKRERGIIL
jgi:hypothetical protein